MLKAIYLDMDGVIVDFVGGVFRTYNLDPGLRTEVSTWDGIPGVLTKYAGHRRGGIPFTDDDLWKMLGTVGARFWAELEWLPWGREVYDLCSSFAPVVLMTTPTKHPSSAAGKMEWIQKHIPEDGYRYAMTPCKHHMAHPGALLVDDNDHNVMKFGDHGGTGFLWPATWNERRERAGDSDRNLADLRDVLTEMTR
jgi:5'(3')-deoxyribonucleotidase